MLERLCSIIKRLYIKHRLPFCSALIAGIAAHGFMLANKIPYGDDLVAMFDKGATTVSGRYGLELMRLILPDISMPWIYGILTLLFLSVTCCFIVQLFNIRKPIFQVILSGAFVCFPAQAATMNYMFTVVPYAIALLSAVSAVYIFSTGKKSGWFCSPLLLAFSCSIYQGYFSIASSFCVILMIKALVNGEKDARETLLYGLKLLSMLILSLAVYGLVIVFFSTALNMPLLSEVINEKQSIVMRVAVAYSAYIKTILSGYFGYVHSTFSMLLHLLLILAAGVAIIVKLRGKGIKVWLLTGLCLFLFPLSCYCLYMLADNSYIHSLSLYNFASLYVLCLCVLDNFEFKHFKELSVMCLALIMCGNIYYANAWYLRNHLRFEETKSLYSSMITQIVSTEGFDENSKLAIIGTAPELVYDMDKHFDFDRLMTPSLDIGSIDYTQLIISRYLGFDIPFADADELRELASNSEVQQMPTYPYDGSVKKIDDYIVVRFS